MNPLIQYWKETFPHYYKETQSVVQFQSPEFKDPIMSAVFMKKPVKTDAAGSNVYDSEYIKENLELPYFSLIIEKELSESKLSLVHNSVKKAGYAEIIRFHLGVRHLEGISVSESETNQKISVLPLSEAIEKKEYWQLLEQGFPEDFEFLLKLMPHLSKSASKYEVIQLMDNREHPIAMLHLGQSNEIALANNVAVAKEFRRSGLAIQLIDFTIDYAKKSGVEKILFWTEHDFLRQYADDHYIYATYTKKE